jgi:hypothetical protein
MDMDPDPGGPKTGGSGSPTLIDRYRYYTKNNFEHSGLKKINNSLRSTVAT